MMSKRLLLLLAVFIALIAVLPITQRAQRSQVPPGRTKKESANSVPGQILVRFRRESKNKQLGQQVLTERTGRQIPASIEAINPAFEIVEGLRVARVNPADTLKAIDALRARPDVLYAEPNYIRRALATPNDPRYAEMWGLKNTGQASTFERNPGTPGNDIRAEQAWNITTGSRSVVVGVVDEGIDVNHEDLHDNIWVNPGEVAGNGVDDDGNGFIDDINGWDFAHNDATVFDYTEPTYPPAANYNRDVDDHGTHVAGTIGAIGNNGIGVTGVNWQVSLMSLKFLRGDAPGTSLDLLKALSYAKAMRLLWDSSGGTKGANLRVLNNSYGGAGFSQAELDAIRGLGDAGILFVVAAGNESVSNDVFPVYPSSYISPNLISVAASGGGGLQASFSNYGAGTVNVTAPGDYILSTTPKNTYNFFSGTSMSTPHVSGTAALVCALSPNITVQKLRSVLMYSGYTAPWLYSFVYPFSTGRAVDAGKALQALSSPDVTPPGAIVNLNALIADTFPSYTLGWVATGDDGNVGRVTAYEVRFSEAAPNDANWDLATPLAGPVPTVDAGSGGQGLTVKIPWRHPSGFIGVRGVDEAGNKGPISSIPISVSAEVGDPYTMSETPATPVSTGGTPLQLIGNDELKTVNLPFTFRFYGIDYTSVTVSTNGALYFGIPPGNELANSERWLRGSRMIAGMWDDLRTDKHPGVDDVYTVQDTDRIIFRWQAVTVDPLLGPAAGRGENPVSFEIELRYDGTITVRYGAGNQKLVPIVGIGDGWPEPYVSASHTSEDFLKDLTNAPAVVFTRRGPIQRGVLTVASSNPNSGVNVTVSPNDIAGSGNGTTQFTRTYNPGTSVTLTAPSTVNGNNFQKWQRDGQDWSGTVSTSLTMDGNRNHTMTAVYSTPPVLTVTSSPATGVNITVTPNDNNGAGNGTTPFTRTYNQFAGVNLNAPSTVGTSTFWKWQLDGVDYVQSQFTTITMNANHTMTAIYITPTPTPTPTPVPGAGAQPIAVVKTKTSGGDNIFLADVDGTNVVNLTNSIGGERQPSWSPDGSKVAFACLRQPNGSFGSPERICVINADGTGLTVLSNTLAEDFGPSWSRDGRQIVFTTFTPGFPSVLSVMNADGTGRFPILIQGASSPDWSPDNATIVFANANAIWIYNRITQNSLRLTNATGDLRPRYSPDGSKIAFESMRDGQSEIYVMNSDGSGQTRLTTNPASDFAPAWSPDGTRILFTSMRENPNSPVLYVMNADGSSQTRVTDGFEGVWRASATGPLTPLIYAEEGTNNAAAVNSVTLMRGPFQILDSHNFSIDGHARITLFTSALGLTAPPIPQASTLSVQANGINLPIESVGPITGVPGLSGSYITVRLPDGLPTGNLSLTVTLRGVTSDVKILAISP